MKLAAGCMLSPLQLMLRVVTHSSMFPLTVSDPEYCRSRMLPVRALA
jgi:hypothetical protein